MKYLSIDIETSGLDVEKCSITTIGIILEDTEKQLSFNDIPKLHLALIHNGIYFEPVAAEINKDYIKTLSSIIKNNGIPDDDTDLIWVTSNEVINKIKDFLKKNNFKLSSRSCSFQSDYEEFYYKINVAGKNFMSFDKLFLDKIPYWKQCIEINRRVLDPAQFYINWTKDNELPNLSTCKQRAGLDSNVSHNAIEDAWDVIMLLRKQY